MNGPPRRRRSVCTVATGRQQAGMRHRGGALQAILLDHKLGYHR